MADKFSHGICDEEGRIQIAYGIGTVRVRLGRSPTDPSVELPASIARDLFAAAALDLKRAMPAGRRSAGEQQ